MPITLERTPIEKQIYAKCLLDNHVSVNAVRRKTGLADLTIRNIRDRQIYSPSLLEDFKRRLPFKAYRMADDVLDCIDINEIKSAPLGTKMIAFGVAIDKARDMEGSNRPVVNIVTMVGDISRGMSELKTKQQALLALRSEQTSTVI